MTVRANLLRGYRFSIPLTLERVYKDSTGTRHVVGVASDNKVDLGGDEMAPSALRKMVSAARRQNLPVVGSHYQTFGFGWTFSGELRSKDNGTKEFVVDVALKDQYAESDELFDSVKSGDRVYQMSIGGFFPEDDPDPVKYVERNGRWMRIIKNIELDHIMVTREGHAMNPRTGFQTAVVRSTDALGDFVFKMVIPETMLVAKSMGALPEPEDLSKYAIGRLIKKHEAEANIPPIIVINAGDPVDADGARKGLLRRLGEALGLVKDDSSVPEDDEGGRGTMKTLKKAISALLKHLEKSTDAKIDALKARGLALALLAQNLLCLVGKGEPIQLSTEEEGTLFRDVQKALGDLDGEEFDAEDSSSMEELAKTLTDAAGAIEFPGAEESDLVKSLRGLTEGEGTEKNRVIVEGLAKALAGEDIEAVQAALSKALGLDEKPEADPNKSGAPDLKLIVKDALKGLDIAGEVQKGTKDLREDVGTVKTTVEEVQGSVTKLEDRIDAIEKKRPTRRKSALKGKTDENGNDGRRKGKRSMWKGAFTHALAKGVASEEDEAEAED